MDLTSRNAVQRNYFPNPKKSDFLKPETPLQYDKHPCIKITRLPFGCAEYGKANLRSVTLVFPADVPAPRDSLFVFLPGITENSRHLYLHFLLQVWTLAPTRNPF